MPSINRITSHVCCTSNRMTETQNDDDDDEPNSGRRRSNAIEWIKHQTNTQMHTKWKCAWNRVHHPSFVIHRMQCHKEEEKKKKKNMNFVSSGLCCVAFLMKLCEKCQNCFSFSLSFLGALSLHEVHALTFMRHFIQSKMQRHLMMIFLYLHQDKSNWWFTSECHDFVDILCHYVTTLCIHFGNFDRQRKKKDEMKWEASKRINQGKEGSEDKEQLKKKAKVHAVRCHRHTKDIWKEKEKMMNKNNEQTMSFPIHVFVDAFLVFGCYFTCCLHLTKLPLSVRTLFMLCSSHHDITIWWIVCQTDFCPNQHWNCRFTGKIVVVIFFTFVHDLTNVLLVNSIHFVCVCVCRLAHT